MTVMKKKRLLKDYELTSDIGDDVIAEALRSVEKHRHRKGSSSLNPSEQVITDETQEIIINPDELFLEESEEGPPDASPIPEPRQELQSQEADSTHEVDSGQRSEEHGSKKKLSRQYVLKLRKRLKFALDQNEELEASLERKTLEARKNYEIALRASADLENFKKRAAREKRELEKYGSEKFLRELLPVIDNLERALQHAKETPELEVLHEGVRMTLVQFSNCLERFGVTRIELTPGTPFDPALHEAMWEEESATCPPNTVAREVLSGYLLQDRLLRASLVSVAKPVQPTPLPPKDEIPPESDPEQEETFSETKEAAQALEGEITEEVGEAGSGSSDPASESSSGLDSETGDRRENSGEVESSDETGRGASEEEVEPGHEASSATSPPGSVDSKEATPGADQETRE